MQSAISVPGKRLRIPGAADATTTKQQQQPKVLRYVVQRGDSLWLIAKRFDTSIRKLLAWNGLSASATCAPASN